MISLPINQDFRASTNDWRGVKLLCSSILGGFVNNKIINTPKYFKKEKYFWSF